MQVLNTRFDVLAASTRPDAVYDYTDLATAAAMIDAEAGELFTAYIGAADAPTLHDAQAQQISAHAPPLPYTSTLPCV